MVEQFRRALIVLLSIALCFYTIIFVNFSILKPQSSLAIFVMLGMALCFLTMPAFKSIKAPAIDEGSGLEQSSSFGWKLDITTRWLLAFLTVVCFGWIFVQIEPAFTNWWPTEAGRPTSLGDRSGEETQVDFWIGCIGLLLVLEATRRSIGWIVPALAIAFLAYAYFGRSMPDWMFPHPGLTEKRIVSVTFLQSLGVLGPAAKVMFSYVFLFVVFGAFLEVSGATQFIIDFSRKLFGRSAGAPAKVSVIGSGLMGSLSGSAVANAVTTGSFTIPMMRNAGFQPSVAGGITAAAATGGALVPPVMGAGAYMMLEFVKPQVTFLEIVRAAIIPAVLYYFSLWMIVHYYAKKVGTIGVEPGGENTDRPVSLFEGCVFFGALGVLVTLLFLGLSAFKAVTGSLVVILVLAIFRKQLQIGIAPRLFAFIAFIAVMIGHQLLSDYWIAQPVFENNAFKTFLAPSWLNPNTGEMGGWQTFISLLNSSFIGAIGLLVFGLIQPSWRPEMIKALTGAAKNGVALVAASACVGIIIGIVQATPIANDFGAAIKSIVETNLFVALLGIMFCSIILGMGVPSVVCYLLMATLMGSLLSELGVEPLAAHLFIFYYGMMSMVTPPVALAAYASASIAKAPIMKTAFDSFKFSLVGFTLPFMFIYRPALLLMPWETLNWLDVVLALVTSFAGVVALAAAVTGFMRSLLHWPQRMLLFVAAILLLAPNVGGWHIGLVVNIAGGVVLAAVAMTNRAKLGE